MKTILITNDTQIAADAQNAGVSRLMVDLESHGKKERQVSRTTFISTHRKEDITALRRVLTTAQLIVRVNPWHNASPEEIEHAIGEGADLVMLPMITDLRQLDAFLTQLNGRAIALPLIETGYSMAHIESIAARETIAELYIGLNDLHLSLGLDFLFEPLGLGLIDWMAARIKPYNKSFGFGGIATLHNGELPAELILAEHVRLGSSAVILSSRFCKDIHIEQAEGRKLRIENALTIMQHAYSELKNRTPEQQQDEFRQTSALIHALAARARNRII